MDELLSLQEFQQGIGQGEDTCRRKLAHVPDETAPGQGSWNRHWPVPEPAAIYALWVLQSSDNGGLEINACLDMKNIGKPCAGIGVGRAFAKQKLAKLHARFDEGWQARDCFLRYPFIMTPFINLQILYSFSTGVKGSSRVMFPLTSPQRY